MSGLKEPDELEPEQGELRLASPDDDYDASDWEAATAAVLRKGRRLGDDDPDDRVWEVLTRTTLDGIDVAPIGSAASLDDLQTSGRPVREGAWDVRAHVSGTGDIKALRESVLAELEAGINSLWLRIDDQVRPDDLPAVLEGVFLDLAPVVLEHRDDDPLAAARALVALLDDQAITPAPGTSLGIDPYAAALAQRSAPAGAAELAAQAVELAGQVTGVGALVVDASLVHDLGASDAQELGWSMAAGVELLRALVEAGHDVGAAAALIDFRYAATDEQFPTIAKLRAARRLWARVLELSEIGEQVPQRQHAVTSRPMMSAYDPWVNMLRTTVAAFAAGVGGADAVTVVPFDSPLGRPDAFGRRIARNTSALLIEESHVARVTDPAGGSYAVERLTDDLARAGWDELGRIEAAGGASAALGDGSFLARIDEVVERRDQEIATRQRPLTGVSEFPHLGEKLPERDGEGDAVRRYGAAFEAMRDEPVDRPVFLATMGPIAAHTARATFATNLFAAGGLAVEPAGATDDVAAVLEAYDSQPVVCLAGTDGAYSEWGADLVAALREAGAAYVVLAGKPGERTVAAGLVDDSCAMGVDAVAFLTRVREVTR